MPNPVGFCAAQDMVGLRFKKSVDYRYMLAVLRSEEIQKTISNNHVGLVIPHFRKQELVKLRLPIIAIEIQRIIGKLYFDISNKIELNNRINAELEAMAKTLYDYWFVQFDFPDAEGKPYKSSGGKMVYNETLKREIPEDWEVKSLSDVSSIITRGISPKYVEEKGLLVLNQKCIRNNTINFSLAKRHDLQTKITTSKLIERGDVLVNSTGVGTLGRVAIVKRLRELFTTVDSHVTIVRIDEQNANRYYVGYSLSARQHELEKLGNGSTGQTEMSREKLGAQQILMPPDNLQERFENILKPIFQKMAVCEIQNLELANLRDWLLPMLMNGQVNVGGAYEQAASALRIAAEPEKAYTK